MALGRSGRLGFKAKNNFVGPRQIQLVAGRPLDVTGISFQRLDLDLLLFLERLLLVNFAVESSDVLLHFTPLMQEGHEKQGDSATDDRHKDKKTERLQFAPESRWPTHRYSFPP